MQKVNFIDFCALLKGKQMTEQWYYEVNGNQNGPIDANELKNLALAGRLNQANVWKEGMKDWVPAHSISDLNITSQNKVENKNVFLGLNQTGTIAFILLLFICLPVCWLPFLISSCKYNKDA